MINNFIPGTGTYGIKELSAQDSVLKELDIGTKYLDCTSAGKIALTSTSAYGTWEFDWYKGGDNNNTFFSFISNTVGGLYNGYDFSPTSTEAIRLNLRTNGSDSGKMISANSYITHSTWYRTKITRTLDGEFTVWMKGGSLGNVYVLMDVSVLGTNPVTENTQTTSKWFVIDFDVGDRIANLLIKEGVEQ